MDDAGKLRRERATLVKPEGKKALKGRKRKKWKPADGGEGAVCKGGRVGRDLGDQWAGPSFPRAMTRGSQVYCSANHSISCGPDGFQVM